ncbi:hypothetical protein FRD01_22365 [Microvenator marinus]|uniref:CENP-V/GFA domain-containing protein n=1 Tax=Microvenator marinus TaxID=2600177 RepID=A0A5B8Y2K2_9DELT|nr:DUF6151 family protein [Microvenator marinus]QED29929.1 hypothetical protein FRD01_22365 [Microvenator marinus]
MLETTEIGCSCGHTRLEVQGEPFLVVECLCESCRAAAARLATLPDADNILTSYGATPSADYRKDRVRITSGQDTLKEFRLKSDAGTRRVVATCCNTPVFLELNGAHWLCLYLHLWPEERRPKPELRTMTGDLADQSALPTDIPNLKTHSIAFFAKLFAAWVAMGFRNPKFEVNGKLIC